MSRMYIDAITLLNNRPTPPDSLDAKGIEGFRCCLRMYNAQIEKQIANRDTDVVEVRHGYWKDRYENKYANHYYECSVCGGAALDGIKNNGLGNPESIQVLSDFCPHCGAKMDGEENKQ